MFAAVLACSGAEPASHTVPESTQALDSLDLMHADRTVVIAQLQHPDPAARKAAAAELSYVRFDHESIPALVDAIRTETDDDVIHRLIGCLLNYQDQRGVDAVAKIYLSESSPANEAPLVSGLRGADPRFVQEAMTTYGYINPERAARFLPNP